MTAAQHPINSGFNYRTAVSEILHDIDLTGKIAIVTGGASGIGLETTRALTKAGALVVVPARDLDKAQQALVNIPGVELAPLDLTDPQSIDRFAENYIRSGRALNMLINNAGIMFTPFGRDDRGFESQFATNHLGHFQLALRLWPALQQAQGARIVSLSSRGHRFSPMNFDDPNFDRRPYDKFIAYGQSKSANSLFAVGADQRGQKDGIRAFAVHPGRILATNLSRHMSSAEVASVPVVDNQGQPFEDPADYIKSVEQGAATSIWAATSLQLDGKGGVYCEDCDVAPIVPAASQGLGVRTYAIDLDVADGLWNMSEQFTGVSLPRS